MILFCFSNPSKSYRWSTLGVTATAFLVGALAFWTPTFLSRGQVLQGLQPQCTKEPCNTTDRCSMIFDLHHPPCTSFFPQNRKKVSNNAVRLCSLYSYIFGAVTLVTGIMGGCLGTLLSRRFRDKVPNADPIICAVGLLGSAPCLFVAIFVASASIPATYVRDKFLSLLVFLCQLWKCIN